ncbi:hypothetical protein Cgig2_004658 [Carnegiea gigantea]|uniref:Uncharacterized protein n=1 Tax=Carnegiea gigantea TaxID=171969 RepID=A0A9Q1Q9R1_9CARY|nr:hypothetical protein Cgig2_004658 [Carnegiea gigantea]
MHASRRGLLEAQLHQRTPPGGGRGPMNDREESSGSNGPPPPPMREKVTAISREREQKNTIMFTNFLSTEQVAEHVRDNFNWSLRESSTFRPNLLPEDHHSLCPNFELLVAMRYAHSSHIPKMFFGLLTLIDGRLVAYIPLKNQFREPKKIPYVVPIFGPNTPSWSSYEYSSTPSILSIQEEVSYPWEIDIATPSLTDVQEQSTAKTKTTAKLRSLDELLAKETSEGKPCSSSNSHRLSEDVEVPSTSTSSSSKGKTSSLGRGVLKKRGHAPEEAVQEAVAKGIVFPGPLERSDIQDGPST